MKLTIAFSMALVAVTSFAQVKRDTLVGVWKPGLEHGKLNAKDAELARKAKAALVGAGLKLNKDGTFGVSMARKIMFGSWRIEGSTLVLDVKEVVGMTKAQVAKMPTAERTAKFRIGDGGKKLISMPIIAAPKPNMVWRKPKE